MPGSDVRDVEALEAFRIALIRFSANSANSLHEIKSAVQAVEAHFREELPAYWRAELRKAEQQLSESRDRLSQMQSAARASDRPAATEAVRQVARAQERLRDCEAKAKGCRTIAVEISQACDKLLGPLADASEHCEVLLPNAAGVLESLIEQLRLYADQPPTSS